jgi:type I restriction enzyme M protein
VCLWFLSKNRENRKEKILFIDARKMGTMITRKHRELSDEEIGKICDTYHNWRDGAAEYEDIKGFCKSAEKEQIEEHEYILTPGRYVGIEAAEDDGEPFDEKMTRLTGDLAEMFVKSHELEDEIKNRLGAIGYEF